MLPGDDGLSLTTRELLALLAFGAFGVALAFIDAFGGRL
jgi:hypothetical protein